MSRIDLPSIYNPANQSPRELIDNFVVREELFRRIFDDIKKSEMTYPQQHYIIQGVRGQGKTTLLLRIVYEIERDRELMKKVIPVCFNEEQYNINRLFKLWETVAQYIENQKGFHRLYDEMRKKEFDEDYEINCFELLEDYLKKNNRKLILFIDNIGDLLDKFSKMEHHRLREIFSESAEIRIIGAATYTLEFDYDYGHPFYQFFRMEHIRGLTSEETRALLLQLGEHYKRKRVKDIVREQPGRVEALRRLTGGVIRTIVLLFQIFVDDEEGDSYKDLEMILDRVTPLYKHRMENLSPQQQEIVDVIGLNWDAVTAGEIAEKTRMPSKAVSAQIGQLEKYHLIEKERTDTKNHLYRLRERFFNIWYLMRRGRKWDEKRVRFLVEFLQIWCDRERLKQRAVRHIESIRNGRVYHKHALFMTEALARTPIERELQDEMIRETRSYLERSESQLLDYLSESDNELINKALRDYRAGDIDSAIAGIKKIKYKDKYYHSMLGLLNQMDNNYESAEKYYLMAVEEGHAYAMNNLALLYFQKRENKGTALEYVRSAFEQKKTAFIAHTYAVILLWNREIEEALRISGIFINDREFIEEYPGEVNFFLMFLISQGQYHTAEKILYENPYNLKDRFKPLYYALMYYMRNEYPNRYRKMGVELKETVDEMVKEIDQLGKDYA